MAYERGDKGIVKYADGRRP